MQKLASLQDRTTEGGHEMTGLEDQIAGWRSALARRPGIEPHTAEQLTADLQRGIEALQRDGLAPDEAFLVALKRLAGQDATVRAIAADAAGQLCQQLIVGPDAPRADRRSEIGALVGFALLAGLAVRLPTLWLVESSRTQWLAAALVVCALGAVVAGWFWWLRRPQARWAGVGLLVGLAVAVLSQALFPYAATSQTAQLAVLHLPIAVGVGVGVAYLGDAWRAVLPWQDYTRFVGELLIHYALIALGGGVLIGLLVALTQLLGLAPDALIEWVLMLGAGGALVVAAWLVETRKGVVANIAPTLTAIFTPLFTLVLIWFLVAMAVTGQIDANREVLIVVNFVLIVVWGLVIFSVASRRAGPPLLGDWLQLALILSAVVVDLVALTAVAGRIGEFGASANKVAALGENLILLMNLCWTAVLLTGFIRGRRPYVDLERWQGRYLPVVGGWAAAVVLVLPPIFGFD